MPTYRVEVDISKDLAYNHANSDITSRVIDISWSLGMSQPYGQMGRVSQLRITLDNSDGQLSQSDTDATYYGLFDVGTFVKVTANHLGTDYSQFVGRIKNPLVVHPDRPNQQPPTAELVCNGLMEELLRAEYTAPLLVNKRVDEGIAELLDDFNVLMLPYAGDYFLVGKNVVGDTLGPDDNSGYYSLQQANTTHPWIGDASDRGEGISAQGFLNDLMVSEANSRFYWGPSGQFIFHHGSYDTENNTLSANMTASEFNDLIPMQWNILNDITVEYEPRELGTAASVVASRPDDADSLELENGDEQVITLSFRDPDNEEARVAATDVIEPVIGTDVVGNTASDGSGSDVSANLGVNAEIGASSVKYTLINNSGSTIYVTTLQLRGTPLLRYQPETVTAKDVTSIAAHGRLKNDKLSIAMISQAPEAQAVADTLLARHKDEQHFFRNGVLLGEADSDDAHWTKIVSYTIGDKIGITESSLGHDSNYTIVGVDHRVNVREHTHQVTWLFQPITGSVVQPGEDTYADLIEEYADNTNDLARYYKNEAGTGTSALDSSPNEEDGTYSSVTHLSSGSPFNDGIHIEWNNLGTDYCDIYAASLFADLGLSNGGNTNLLTITALVEVDTALWSGTDTATIIRLYGDANNEIKIEAIGGTGFVFTYKAGGTTASVTCDASDPTDYVHVAMTIDEASDEMKAYLNKNQVGTTQTVGTWNVASLDSTACVFGAADKVGTNEFDGSMSHVSLSNHLFDSTQISNLATKAGTTTTLSCSTPSSTFDSLVSSHFGANLVQFLKLNESSGATASDSSGNSYDGEYNGTTPNSGGAPDTSEYSQTFDTNTDDVEWCVDSTQGNDMHTDMGLDAGNMECSIGICAKSTDWTSGAQYVFRFRAGNDDDCWIEFISGTGVRFRIEVGANVQTYDYATLDGNTDWHHYVITFDNVTNDEIVCYVDGTAVKTFSSFTDTWGGTEFQPEQSVLGNISRSGSTHNFIGDMSRFYMGNTILSASQVSDQYDQMTNMV